MTNVSQVYSSLN